MADPHSRAQVRMDGARSAPSPKRIWTRPTSILLASALLVVAVLFVFDPSSSWFYPGCVFYRTTGLLCPGCGSLRALHQLLHGHLATALRFNPLLILTLPLVLWLTAAHWVRRKEPATETGRRLRYAWLWVYLAVALLFGVLRNIPGQPFTWMRP